MGNFIYNTRNFIYKILFSTYDELKFGELKRRLDELENKNKNIISNSKNNNNNEEKIIELKKQIKSLKNINKCFEKKIKEYECIEINQIKENNINIINNNAGLTKLISKEQINSYIEKLLNDDNINIKYLPNFVERQIYKNIFNILIGVMDNIIESSSLTIMDHKIDMVFDSNGIQFNVSESNELNE